MKNLLAIPIISTCLFISSCSSSNIPNEVQKKFTLTNPILVDTLVTQNYIAEINALQNVEIRSRIGGFLEAIHMDEGQEVQSGQLLFTISSKEFEQELIRSNALLKSSIAELKIAEIDVKNTQSLVEKNIVSLTELELAKAKMDAAQAKVDEAKSAVSSAKLNLSFAAIKAPFSGIINRHPLKAGSLIEQGDLLTSISNNQQAFAYFKVSENEYLEILKQKDKKENQSVNLILSNGQQYAHKGKVEIAESEIDKSTGSISFRARFDNPEGLLKHGASGKIQINTRLSRALIIPQKACFEIQENTYVFVVDKNNTVRARAIKIKQRLPHLYIIESGLSEKDVILYEGIQYVKEGDQISSEILSMKTIINQLGTIQ